MNYVVQAIENLYKYGNAILYIGKYNCQIIFLVNSTGKLELQVDIDHDGIIDSFDLTAEEGLTHIAFLVFYSLTEYACDKDAVYLTVDTDYQAESVTIIAINELYRQLLSILSLKNKHIEELAKTNCSYTTLANIAEYKERTFEPKSAHEIIDDLANKFEDFKNAIMSAQRLWNIIKDGQKANTEEYMRACIEWNAHFTKVPVNNVSDRPPISLKDINVTYELLNDTSYPINPAIGREEELENLEIALLMPSKSALLVGESGVGKTAIVEGLAYRINKGLAPLALQNKKILKINTSSIIKGCTLVGMLEQKVELIMEYLKENPDTILFLDELHTTIDAGTGGHSNLDLANMIKPYLDRGQIKIIGATTLGEYENYIRKEKAFNRRFYKIVVPEPKNEVIYQILAESVSKLELVTGVSWKFDYRQSHTILTFLIESTKEAYRNVEDRRCNPDISLTILEYAFAVALRNDRSFITVEDIATALNRCELLYPSIRTTFAHKLLSSYHNLIDEQFHSKPKIIYFSKQSME